MPTPAPPTEAKKGIEGKRQPPIYQQLRGLREPQSLQSCCGQFRDPDWTTLPGCADTPNPGSPRLIVRPGLRVRRPSALPTAVVLLGDQLSMPGEQGLRCHDSGHFRQDGPPQPLGLGGQPATLIVVQAKSLAAELFPEHSIFLPQILNCVQLALAHPARHGDQQKAERVQAL